MSNAIFLLANLIRIEPLNPDVIRAREIHNTQVNELTSARNIADILSSSIRMGDRFLNTVDKVNDGISVIQSLQSAFNLASNPSSIIPSGLSSVDTLKLPNLEEASTSLRANLGNILKYVIVEKIPREVKKIREHLRSSTSVYAFYLPDVFPQGLNIPTGLSIQSKSVRMVTNKYKTRLFGMGMILNPNSTNSDSIQFFRIDYGEYTHDKKPDLKSYKTWQDGDFHYHIPKNQ